MFGADRSTMRLSEGYRNAALAAFVALLGFCFFLSRLNERDTEVILAMPELSSLYPCYGY